MFGVDTTELLLIAVVALVVIGPKDLPRVMRTVGNWVGRARGMARHFRSGIDTMMREAELEEMEAKWKAENERIMGETPAAGETPADPLLPPPVDNALPPRPSTGSTELPPPDDEIGSGPAENDGRALP